MMDNGQNKTKKMSKIKSNIIDYDKNGSIV